MVKKKLTKRTTTEYEYEEDYGYHDLGPYCLLFKESCRILCSSNLSSTAFAVLFYALGNMRDDGQVYINKSDVVRHTGFCYSGIGKALKLLDKKNILMRVDKYNYQMGLTHVINQRIAFQGKLTVERAKNIVYKMPMICAAPVDNSDEFETDEFNDDIGH